jgi:hypothetical protein
MSDGEAPSARYHHLAQECLKMAATFPAGEHRDALLQMAQVWQRLADQYKDGTPPFSLPAAAAEQPVMQQQQQVQREDDKKD